MLAIDRERTKEILSEPEIRALQETSEGCIDLGRATVSSGKRGEAGGGGGGGERGGQGLRRYGCDVESAVARSLSSLGSRNIRRFKALAFCHAGWKLLRCASTTCRSGDVKVKGLTKGAGGKPKTKGRYC